MEYMNYLGNKNGKFYREIIAWVKVCWYMYYAQLFRAQTFVTVVYEIDCGTPVDGLTI